MYLIVSIVIITWDYLIIPSMIHLCNHPIQNHNRYGITPLRGLADQGCVT